MASNGGEIRRRVTMISLRHKSFFDETYGPLLQELSSKSNIQRVKKAESAIRILAEEPAPSAILITDEALTVDRYSHVWDAVLQYVRQGGVAVIIGHFPCFVKPLSIAPFFAKAGLPWAQGSYHRTTLVLNRNVVSDAMTAKIPENYSQKAVFLQNVDFADTWYRTDENSVTESLVFPGESAHRPGETPVAFTSIGEGKLGYIGDVNGEEGSNDVVLAMCGL